MGEPRRAIAHASDRQDGTSPLPQLTPRESAVLEAVATGETNREIGRRLGIGEQTVKNHVSILMQKLYVRNRVQLAVLVARQLSARLVADRY